MRSAGGQILADVLGRPVTHVTRRRATQRGTALLALDVLAPDAPRASRATGTTYEPRPAHVEHYAQRRVRFAELYDTGQTPGTYLTTEP
ncbi:hypothetical protein [Paractinoplanes ovalisporus]|uniref:hypothetical protein n=1 Tax=Paractinoplanes ovalisporus TaxID=2810368 RepID=UPI001F38C37D|nr:hypothetical protein [Actinoplanes ovalisporus]